MDFIDRIGYDAGGTRLEDALQTAVTHGIHYLDFKTDTGPNLLSDWSDQRVGAVRQTCQQHNIKVSLHTASSVNIAEVSPFVSEAADQYLRGNIDLAQRLGCHGMVVHGGYHFKDDKAERMAASLERLKRAVAYAEGKGVTLFLENLNWEPDDAEVHYLAHTVEECQYYFNAVASPRFGWAFTINHAHLVPEDIEGFQEAFGVTGIGEVRLADNLGVKEVHLPPGQGNIDFPQMFRRLEGASYRGYYTMAFGSLADKLAARQLFAGYGVTQANP